MTRVGLSLYRIAPFIVNGPDHVAPWSVDLKRTLPGSNVCRKTTNTVPSAATRICGSNCQPLPGGGEGSIPISRFAHVRRRVPNGVEDEASKEHQCSRMWCESDQADICVGRY